MNPTKKMVWSPVNYNDDKDNAEKSEETNGFQVVPLAGELQTDRDMQCGIGSCTPGFLQVFTNMLSFSFYFGLAGLVTSALSLYLTSQLTTLEKQFGLNSSETGLILSMNDIGFLICVIPLSHLFRYYHKPRVLGFCTLIFGLSAIVCVIPHFVTPTIPLEATTFNGSNAGGNSSFPVLLSSMDRFKGESLCTRDIGGGVDGHLGTGLSLTQNDTGTGAVEQCTKAEAKSHAVAKAIALGLICTGMFFQGFAKAPRHPLAQTYIDDNVIKTKTALYMGIIACLSIFGPVIAFAVGAVVSQIYVTLAETDLSVRDPRWIGAWWLGFLIFGFAALVVAVPLFFFPRRMSVKTKTTEEIKRQKEIAVGEHVHFTQRMKDMPKAVVRLFTNFVYTCMVATTAVEFFVLAGSFSFAPKYFEVHFGVSTFKANMIMGTTSMVAASTGMLIGGIIATKLKLQLMGCVKLVIVMKILSGLAGAVCLFMACPQPHIEGLQQYGNEAIVTLQPSMLEQIGNHREFPTCNSGCGCHGNAYFPVCGSDGVSYFSPCVAGCSSKMGYRYSDCACVSNMTATNGTAFIARPGLCSKECDLLAPYIAFSVLAAFIGTVSAMPHTVALLRSVSEKDKSIAVGVSSFLSSLLGWMLGPVIFGKIIDTTCSLWHTSCSKRGACAIYDIADIRLKLHGIAIGGRFIGLLLYIAILVKLLSTTKVKEDNRDNPASQPCKDEEKLMLTKLDESLEPVRISSL